MRKTEFLEYWEEIESNQEVIPEPLPYKHEGSTFDHDTTGIKPIAVTIYGMRFSTEKRSLYRTLK